MHALVFGAAACKRLAEARRARVHDLGDVCLMPGLVNAHAHLELSEFQGLIPGELGFGAWVGKLLQVKAERGAASLERGAESGLNVALRSGTTTVGDIASTPATLAAIGRLGRRHRPRVRLFRELIDAWDSGRTAAALETIRKPLDETARLFEGFSPHAPFTVSRSLLQGLARMRVRRARPVSMHWAETQAEVEWMRRGTGALAPVLGDSPKQAGLTLLDEAGLLGPDTSLVHGNLPGRGEPALIAARGASVIHCPGTHAFFERGAFPLRRYEAAGVNLALGTDSLASNDSLDLRAEARRLLRREESLAPARVLEMATEGGALALGLSGVVGRLEPGCFADALAIPMCASKGVPTSESLATQLFFGTAAETAGGGAGHQVLMGGRLAVRLV